MIAPIVDELAVEYEGKMTAVRHSDPIWQCFVALENALHWRFHRNDKAVYSRFSMSVLPCLFAKLANAACRMEQIWSALPRRCLCHQI